MGLMGLEPMTSQSSLSFGDVNPIGLSEDAERSPYLSYNPFVVKYIINNKI